MNSPDGTAIAALLREADDLATVQRIVRTAARALARTDGATFVLRDVDHCFYADEDAISPLWKGQRFPITNCISGWAMLHGQTVVVPDITTDDRIPIDAYRPTFVKSLAMIPVGDEKPIAAIGAYWATLHTATSAEIAALETLASLTAAALNRIGLFGAPPPPILAADPGDGTVDLAPADRSASLAGLADRERIARDLHDTVLQNLYAANLQMRRVRTMASGDALTAAVDEAATLVTSTLTGLRGVIFGLEYGHERLAGLRGHILTLAASSARTLGFVPNVTLTGPLDDTAPEVRDDVLAVLSEMLSNTARHARASRVDIECHAGPPLTVRVSDDGSGPPPNPTRGNGTANLTSRAGQYGGAYTLTPRRPRGSIATWTVPVS